AWDGGTEFSAWMSSDINNAAIGSIGAYHGLVPAFQAILVEEDHDLARFMEVCGVLAKMDTEDRERLLNQARSGIPIRSRLPPRN
ncbi:MAG: aminopeptidase, partial [Pseudomonadales bacterium]|nr:aminopeptidase [Pseudomonadales bacterium]